MGSSRSRLGLAMRRWLLPLAATALLAACGGGGDDGVTAGRETPLADSVPISGAVFTTNVDCVVVNGNVRYDDKDAVYLDGGPSRPGSAGLPANSSFYVIVTNPSGDKILGTSSLNTDDQVPYKTDSNGNVVGCLQLSSIVTSPTTNFKGYDDTNNPGGEYKVWVCLGTPPADLTQPNDCKTDNFKVRSNDPTDNPDPRGKLTVEKYYDANANGVDDDGPSMRIQGWKIRISPDPTTGLDYAYDFTKYQQIVLANTYTVKEFDSTVGSWIHTTPTIVSADVVNGGSASVVFGNLCLGSGGGLTLGFWSNRNGQDAMTKYNGGGMDGALAFLRGLNLRNPNDSAFDPTTYTAFKNWLLNGNAVNMQYMLSVQLAAMELNVLTSKASGFSLIFAPGTTSANSLGFATVNAVMNEANLSLGDGGNKNRSYQEALKNALDNANNNRTFVQPSPATCPIGFADKFPGDI